MTDLDFNVEGLQDAYPDLLGLGEGVVGGFYFGEAAAFFGVVPDAVDAVNKLVKD